jgi:hypothetical protein
MKAHVKPGGLASGLLLPMGFTFYSLVKVFSPGKMLSYITLVLACYSGAMEPDKDKSRKPAREEFEVAYYTKELGRSLRRKLLQRRLADLSDNGITAASHGEEDSPELNHVPPREDRAG